MKAMTEMVPKSAIERVQAARHPDRPYSLDMIDAIFENFSEIHGDRRYSDDAAIVCGFAKLDGREVVVIGQQKGRDLNQRRFRNFAMPKPEGYRKALRVMKLAEKFGRPIVTFVDTPGAYPGIDAEERGQAEAIAFNLREMAGMKVPIVVIVIGEGGSGGALAIGVGDRVLMMENAVYSVITPEGCAAILWKDSTHADKAASALRLTASDLQSFGLVDSVIRETAFWEVKTDEVKVSESNSAFDSIAGELKSSLIKAIDELEAIKPETLVLQRFKKFRQMGKWA